MADFRQNRRVGLRHTRMDAIRWRRRMDRLQEPGFEFDNLLLQTGDHLLLESGTVANPDVLKLQSTP